MSALDVQVGGDHYKKYKIQPMEYSMANGLDACQHTAIKYITRFRDKGGIADLEKAKHCIDLLIEFERNAAGPVEDAQRNDMAFEAIDAERRWEVGTRLRCTESVNQFFTQGQEYEIHRTESGDFFELIDDLQEPHGWTTASAKSFFVRA